MGKEHYKILGIIWGPVVVAVGLSLFFFGYVRPNKSPRVPEVPRAYREVPQVTVKPLKESAPRTAIIREAFLPAENLTAKEPIAGPPEIIPASPKTFEIEVILRIGERKLCKIEDKILREGDRVGPFQISYIGENYVDLVFKNTRIRLFMGERLYF